MRERSAWQLLAMIPDLGPRTCKTLVETLGGPVEALRAVARGQVAPLRVAGSPTKWRRRLRRALRRARRVGATTLTPADPGYPPDLRHIADPPAMLYVRGALPVSTAVAVIGSRACTAYGRRTARRLAAELVGCDLPVVSGLALGVDSHAHRGALDAGGVTVAVLPCGIDRVYPARHRSLARRILERGALVTEFEPGASAAPWCFPKRNRIIAGLSMVVVVVEAAARSGTSITAGLAAEAGRQVMVVPGPVDSATSVGTNRLLVEGAPPCTTWQDVVDQLPEPLGEEIRRRREEQGGRPPPGALGKAERDCLAAIPERGSCTVDRLASTVAVALPRLLAALTRLEARGLVRRRGGQSWERS